MGWLLDLDDRDYKPLLDTSKRGDAKACLSGALPPATALEGLA